MKIKIIILISLLSPLLGKSQNDTINQRDENDHKQGQWVYYGKDRPESGYPENGKMEEGRYVDDRKEGLWIRYHIDGITPKLKGEYKNNRPSGNYWKYNEDGTVKDSGVFVYNKGQGALTRGRGAFDNNSHQDTIIASAFENKNDSVASIDKRLEIRGCVTGGAGFNENGYNKLYNENDDIWQDGEFRNRRLWDGKVYLYDSDGILISVKIFKNGVFHSDGRF